MTEHSFAARHIGPSPDDVAAMLKTVGHGTVEELMAAAIPDAIRWAGALDLPPAATEAEALTELPTERAGGPGDDDAEHHANDELAARRRARMTG